MGMDRCARASRRVLCHRGQNLRPFFTLVSEGNPFRRLLVISKGRLVVVEPLHGTSPVSALCGPRILAYADLTPELSRAAARHWRWSNDSRPAPRPRSGLGLSELLDRCQPWLFDQDPMI